MDCVPKESPEAIRVSASVCQCVRDATPVSCLPPLSIHYTPSPSGAFFINIPISAVPDCSICRNKLGIVFDIRLKTL